MPGDAGRSRSVTLTLMIIKVDDPARAVVALLLRDHLRSVSKVSPPESTHALDIDGLRRPGITFWSAWEGEELAGCGALKELDPRHGEIKSMVTAAAFLRRGVAARLLEHMIREAGQRRYGRLSLETGSQDYFEPARRLYSKYGFRFCAPFADYAEDPNSVFMTKEL